MVREAETERRRGGEREGLAKKGEVFFFFSTMTLAAKQERGPLVFASLSSVSSFQRREGRNTINQNAPERR